MLFRSGLPDDSTRQFDVSGPGWNALGQIALGYSFAQFSIQLQIWLQKRKGTSTAVKAKAQ